MIIKIKMPVFYAKVIVVAEESREDIKFLESVQFPLNNKYIAQAYFVIEGGKLPNTVYIHTKTAAMSVIAHEAVHATSLILMQIGHDADFENDEVQAYMVQYICEACERKIWCIKGDDK